MEQISDTKEVLLESEEVLQRLIEVTGEKLLSLEKLNPHDVQTRVKYKEMERNAISMRKHIKDILQEL